MKILFSLIDIVIIALFIYFIIKFWILKIPEVRRFFSLSETKSKIDLAKKNLTSSQQLNEEVDKIVEEFDKNKDKKVVRKSHKKTLNQFIKEDL